jgi:hypothetical protein
LSGLSDYTAKFVRQVKRFRNCCNRVEKQWDRGGVLKITDVELVYASSFISVCSLWESLLERALVEVVCGRDSVIHPGTRLVEFRNRSCFRRILLHPNRDYLSVSTIKKVQELASLYVRGGLPFSEVSETSKQHVQQAIWIRNAIAHQNTDSEAMRVFKEKVPGVDALPAVKRKPGPFLRHRFRTSPDQRRLELYFAGLQRAAQEIGEAW